MLSEFFTKRFGLTKEGSDNLIKGIFYTALLNISFMFPVSLYALLIYLWVEQLTGGEIIDPNLGIFILLILIVYGFLLVSQSWNRTFNTLKMSYAWCTLAVPVGSLLMFFSMIGKMLGDIRKPMKEWGVN